MTSRLRTFLTTPSFWILTVALLVVYIPIYLSASWINDYTLHAGFAIDIYENGIQEVSHFLYHLMYLAIYIPFPYLSSETISMIPVTFASVIVGLTIYSLLTVWFEDILPTWSRQLITLSLLMMGPIIIWLNMPYLSGYMNFNVYHNPTQNILKLFAIPVSLVAFRALYPQPYQTRTQQISFTVLTSVLTVLMVISKPSYTIVLLPTLGAYTLHHIIKQKAIDWSLLIFGIGLPAVIVLLAQYTLVYASSDESGIGVGIAEVMRIHNDDEIILPKLLLSILFPLLTYLLHFDSARKDPYLNFTWVALLFGLILTYFFHETGPRMRHGNFVWSAYITLFIVMFSSVVFLIREYRDFFIKRQTGETAPIPKRLILIGLIFGLHLLSGIYYYIEFLNR